MAARFETTYQSMTDRQTDRMSAMVHKRLHSLVCFRAGENDVICPAH